MYHIRTKSVLLNPPYQQFEYRLYNVWNMVYVIQHSDKIETMLSIHCFNRNMTYKDILICIPRVENIITKDFVHQKICKTNAGKIKYIIEKPLKKEKNFKRLLIKMAINMKNQMEIRRSPKTIL